MNFGLVRPGQGTQKEVTQCTVSDYMLLNHIKVSQHKLNKCIFCNKILSNNYPCSDPDHLSEMPSCINCKGE